MKQGNHPMNSDSSHELREVSKPTLITKPGTDGALQSHKAGRLERTLDRAQCVILYLWGERRTLLAAVVTLTILVLYLIGHALDWTRLLTWEALSIVSSVLAFFVGVAIFLNEAVENSEARLPKRLSVYFLDPEAETTRLVCQRAHLSGEGDIRAWGQQIGLQICNHPNISRLDFTPFVDLRRLGLEKREGALFTHYQAVFRLRTLPDPLKTELDQASSRKGFPVAKVLMPRANDPHGGVDIVLDDAANYQPVR
jgi:hypothetical protein